ncbi:efflux RND transporter permease subunit [Natronolimnobius baerhuensis]|uniref:RND transporter n=1 Tax=Natronolimnobius baerhuensis TaxID=253108 RepID=A0A202EAX3_9EURY|nr:MMPL family transporter [Natronolimnobius baerhuensis]OVE85328.1 RND transporter [Natronolimnobius baerhuensis]
MSRSLATRYADALVEHSRVVIVLTLLVTAIVAAGVVIGDPEDGDIGQFDADSEETEALEEIEATYGTDDDIVTQIVIRGTGDSADSSTGDVLTRESFLEGLELQQDIRDTESLNATLADQGVLALENVVATGAVFEDRAAEANGPPDTSEPTLEEQIEALEDRSDEEFEELLETVLDPDGDAAGADAGSGEEGDPYEFLPTDYEPGSTTADSRVAFVFQIDDGGPDEDPEAAYAAQLEIDALVDERFDDAFVFGQGITDEASSNAVGDSFGLITPVALILVLVALGTAYRDVVDVLVSIFGIAVVMAWLGGIQGWLEVPSSQLLIAVPFLLIGLSIDYSLHVIMRSREARTGQLEDDTDASPQQRGVRNGMRLGLAGVVLALAAATFSTGIGFLSNVVSPLPAIRDFALLSAGGIFATFVAFAILVPALKVELDDLLESRFGRDRTKQPFGLGTGPVNRALTGVVSLVQRGPVVVVLIALLLASGGVYGAAGIDTEFNQADFLPEDAPEWAKSLPGPIAPDTYTISDDAAYLGDNFQERGEGSQSQILIRGAITDPAALSAIESATDDIAASDENTTISIRADGDPAVESPVTAIRTTAAENDSVATALEERDTTDNDLPDEDLEGLYDELYAADEDAASSVIYRTDDGEYDTMRLLLTVRGDAASQSIADDTRDVASMIETESDGAVTAVAAGGPVTTAVVQDALLETLVQAFAVTLVVILVFLTILYWVRHRKPAFGVLTLAPVVAALAWLLGTMAVLDVPFNSETAVITSLAIGLGVDYSIHVSERFLDERERQSDANGNLDAGALENTLRATITGTGGALLGSALTTAAGFGVLALALAPPLQRFGLVTGLSIIFAFVACMTVLPCLLVLRERVHARFA